MEQLKVVSGFDGSKPRKLLINSFEEYQQLTGADTEKDNLAITVGMVSLGCSKTE